MIITCLNSIVAGAMWMDGGTRNLALKDPVLKDPVLKDRAKLIAPLRGKDAATALSHSYEWPNLQAICIQER